MCLSGISGGCMYIVGLVKGLVEPKNEDLI